MPKAQSIISLNLSQFFDYTKKNLYLRLVWFFSENIQTHVTYKVKTTSKTFNMEHQANIFCFLSNDKVEIIFFCRRNNLGFCFSLAGRLMIIFFEKFLDSFFTFWLAFVANQLLLFFWYFIDNFYRICIFCRHI